MSNSKFQKSNPKKSNRPFGLPHIILVLAAVLLFLAAGFFYPSVKNKTGASNQAAAGSINSANPGFTELKGKSAIFFGDSVAYGHTTNGKGFGYYINAKEKFRYYKNAAVSTATLNTVTQGTNHIIEQLKQNKDTSYDFVILQGGYGDLRDTPPLGSLTEGYDIHEFDTTTFAGAVEYTLYLAVTYWPNARIGYIISYDTPNSNYGVRPNHEETKKYWDMVKSACRKWNVAYLDLFEGSVEYRGETKTYSDLFEVTSNKYLAKDHIHPTAKGYRFICPFLADWMKTLPVYEQNFEPDAEYKKPLIP